MTRLVLVARYFTVVAPVRPPILALFAMLAVLSIGSALVQRDASRLPLDAVLILQAFAASSSVYGSARAGYFDGLMARGLRREEILLGHWAASVAPGLLCWAVVSGVGLVAGLADGPRALTSGSVLALWLVSSLPWAATVVLPRFTGAIAWLVGCATLAEVGSTQAVRHLSPLELVGHSVAVRDLVWLWPALAASVLSVAGVVMWFRRASFTVEAEP